MMESMRKSDSQVTKNDITCLIGLEDVSKYVELFSALYASGKWTIQELKQLAGLNFLRVWREVEKVGIQHKKTSLTFQEQYNVKNISGKRLY